LRFLVRLRSPVALAALVSTVLSLFLYSSSLTLPFYSDDLLQFPWIETTPLLEFWRSVGPYEDYQPLHFTLWRSLYVLIGDLQPWLVHTFNLIGHAVCGTLVGLLASRRTDRPRLSAALASALFAAFPFAFDVVPWASAFCYPLTIGLALGAVLCYWQGREQGSRAHHLLAVALTAVAGLTYEGGVVTGLAVVLAEATCVAGRKDWRWGVVHLVAAAVPLGLIAHFAPVSTLWLSGVRSLNNLLVGMQCLTFPVAPLATLLGRTVITPGTAMGAVGVCAILAAGYLAHRTGRQRWFWFGLGWSALWSAIPLLNLRFNWERDPLRVLYPGAVGAAMLWTSALAGAFPGRGRQSRRLLWFALVLVALVPSLCFVKGRMDLWQRSGRLLWQVVEAASDDGPTLFVNLPGRITPRTRLFPLGHEGVIPLPPPTNTDLLVRIHTGRENAAMERVAGEVLPPLPYQVELAGAPLTDDDLRAASDIFVLACWHDQMTMEKAGHVVAPQPHEAKTSVARFGKGIVLLSASCRRSGPGLVALHTRCQVLGPVEGSPTVFAHLLGNDGALLAQADGHPLRGLYPFNRWRPGEVVHDVRGFDGVPPGAAVVAVGVWEPAVGARWEAVGANGQRLADDALRWQVAGE